MRSRAFLVSLLYVASAALAVSVAAPAASAATTGTVNPDTELSGGDIVTVAGEGFPLGDVTICQAVVAGAPPGAEGCDSSAVVFVPAGADGTFSTPFTVRRFVTVGPAPNPTQVDCASPGATCAIGAANTGDILNTLVIRPISFAPPTATPRPDLIFKQRATQQLYEDNVYFPTAAAAPRHRHALAADGTWTFALVVQNDGDVIDDLVLTAPIVPSTPFAARIFFGYFDVTSAVTRDGGLVFHDVAPGQSFTFAVNISGVGAHGMSALTAIKLHSATEPALVDYARLLVTAP
jgi:hypothetical protein